MTCQYHDCKPDPVRIKELEQGEFFQFENDVYLFVGIFVDNSSCASALCFCFSAECPTFVFAPETMVNRVFAEVILYNLLRDGFFENAPVDPYKETVTKVGKTTVFTTLTEWQKREFEKANNR